MFSPPYVTRSDPRGLTRRPPLLPFRRVLRGPRTLGIGVAHGGRAGKDVPPGTDSGRGWFSPFSGGQLRGELRALDGSAPFFAGIAVKPLCTTIRLWLEALETVSQSPPPPLPQLQ